MKEYMEHARCTGRSNRIINFIVEQLVSIGEVIATDHTVFEYPGKVNNTVLLHFIERVQQRIRVEYRHLDKNIDGKIIKLENGIKVIHFTLKNKN